MSKYGSLGRTPSFALVPATTLPDRWQKMVTEMPSPLLATMATVGLSSIVQGLGGEESMSAIHPSSSPLLSEIQRHYSLPNTFLPGHSSDPESPQALWFGAGTSLLIALQGATSMLRHPQLRSAIPEGSFNKWTLQVPAGLEQACLYRATGERKGLGIGRFSLLTTNLGDVNKIAIRAAYVNGKRTRTVSCTVEQAGTRQWTIEAKKIENGANSVGPAKFSEVGAMGQALQMAAYTKPAV